MAAQHQTFAADVDRWAWAWRARLIAIFCDSANWVVSSIIAQAPQTGRFAPWPKDEKAPVGRKRNPIKRVGTTPCMEGLEEGAENATPVQDHREPRAKSLDID